MWTFIIASVLFAVAIVFFILYLTEMSDSDLPQPSAHIFPILDQVDTQASYTVFNSVVRAGATTGQDMKPPYSFRCVNDKIQVSQTRMLPSDSIICMSMVTGGTFLCINTTDGHTFTFQWNTTVHTWILVNETPDVNTFTMHVTTNHRAVVQLGSRAMFVQTWDATMQMWVNMAWSASPPVLRFDPLNTPVTGVYLNSTQMQVPDGEKTVLTYELDQNENTWNSFPTASTSTVTAHVVQVTSSGLTAAFTDTMTTVVSDSVSVFAVTGQHLVQSNSSFTTILDKNQYAICVGTDDSWLGIGPTFIPQHGSVTQHVGFLDESGTRLLLNNEHSLVLRVGVV